jgi:hypothetical protein
MPPHWRWVLPPAGKVLFIGSHRQDAQCSAIGAEISVPELLEKIDHPDDVPIRDPAAFAHPVLWDPGGMRRLDHFDRGLTDRFVLRVDASMQVWPERRFPA